uniref:Aspartate--ammonia ligase n=1 Tax=Schistosoma japonicum TaxID=6182 RepID=C7TXT3_SCHJA|nr:aspartate--ammonia ligase [Schistosoma japonicum]CAX82431.1 aspartate--ammonia ligase [Schistosoma japonicum]CAX82434.1 aspartate--ammonia ligase [Schistosoma japonicum]
MSKYQSKLDVEKTQGAIKYTRHCFQKQLSTKLNLLRVSAPLFVPANSGLQDDLSGVERAISFNVKSGELAFINQSLAKWKRMALHKYKLHHYDGIYTDMNAVRRDEVVSPLHSYYVDQWDWEMIIQRDERNDQKLEEVVEKIYSAMKETEKMLVSAYPVLNHKLPENIKFITTQELEDLYPDRMPSEREYLVVKQYGAVFLKQIGKLLKSNMPHDNRAPDYDDWELNGDILVYSEHDDRCIELSSMGIRVDEVSMERQLKQSGCEERKQLEYHQNILNGKYPLTIGGGIGQSRLCMFFMEKKHIGEVQVSIWPEHVRRECEENNIFLL